MEKIRQRSSAKIHLNGKKACDIQLLPDLLVDFKKVCVEHKKETYCKDRVAAYHDKVLKQVNNLDPRSLFSQNSGLKTILDPYIHLRRAHPIINSATTTYEQDVTSYIENKIPKELIVYINSSPHSSPRNAQLVTLYLLSLKLDRCRKP